MMALKNQETIYRTSVVYSKSANIGVDGASVFILTIN